MDENIKLEYPVIIKYGEDAYYADRCEFFMDEHSIQWVKFRPRNGYHSGKEHMVRTHLVVIIRDKGYETTQAS